MKLPFKCRNYFIAGLVMLMTLALASPGLADTYHSADFSGSINGGNSNCKYPFNTIISQGGPVSGNFVYDDQLIPASSPFPGVNVKFSSFPDIGLIPPATAFTIDLGAIALTFTLADAIQNSGAIQYLNGQFNGFFFVTDFDFFVDNRPYRLAIQGLVFSIKLLDQIGGSPVPLTSAFVNGKLITSLTNVQPYVPSSPAPLPPTIVLLGSSLAGLIGMRKVCKK
jgi:hypothetical protein